MSRLFRARVARGLLLAGGTLAGLVAACGDDEAGTGPTPEMRQFCEELFASPGFACCSEADRGERQFAARYRYQSVEDCAQKLGVGTVEGRRAFDPASAQSCLAHIGSWKCGAAPTSAVRIAEEQAGCGRVLKGLQQEGQTCVDHDDCAAGLICPPLRETGGFSTCSKPAPLNQVCIGTIPKHAVDHPACEAGLTCTFVGEAPACAVPPCLVFQCVPPGQEGDPCTSGDCGPGLQCMAQPGQESAVCTKVDGPSPQGGPCRTYEHCADGLYCDVSTATCLPKKAAGEPCVSPLNTLLECKGFCGQGGVCVPFCGSD